MYTVAGMTDKNKDALVKDLTDLIISSGNAFLQALFPDRPNPIISQVGHCHRSYGDQLDLPIEGRSDTSIFGIRNRDVNRLLGLSQVQYKDLGVD